MAAHHAGVRADSLQWNRVNNVVSPRVEATQAIGADTKNGLMDYWVDGGAGVCALD